VLPTIEGGEETEDSRSAKRPKLDDEGIEILMASDDAEGSSTE
jgi:hypothetical protein